MHCPTQRTGSPPRPGPQWLQISSEQTFLAQYRTWVWLSMPLKAWIQLFPATRIVLSFFESTLSLFLAGTEPWCAPATLQAGIPIKIQRAVKHHSRVFQRPAEIWHKKLLFNLCNYSTFQHQTRAHLTIKANANNLRRFDALKISRNKWSKKNNTNTKMCV